MKEIILKATGLTEEQFYEKYPTMEDFFRDYPEYREIITPRVEPEPIENEQQENFDSLSFKEAFAKARQQGLKTFVWRNKLYGTKLASEKTPIELGYSKDYPNQYALGGFMNPEVLNRDTILTGSDQSKIINDFKNKNLLAGLSIMAQAIPFIGGFIKKPNTDHLKALGKQGDELSSLYSTGSDINSAARGIAETVISPFAGGLLKKDNNNNVEVKFVDFSGENDSNKVKIKRKGGILSDIDFGNKHEFGGVKINKNAEVEKGETISKGFVFSDYLINPKTGRTFAKDSKIINDKFTSKNLRVNDPLTKEALQIELGRLAKEQEDLKQEQELMQQTEIFDLGGLLFDPNPKTKSDLRKAFRFHKKILKQPDLENMKNQMVDYMKNRANNIGKEYVLSNTSPYYSDYINFVNDYIQSRITNENIVKEIQNSKINGLPGFEPIDSFDAGQINMIKNNQVVPVKKHINQYALGGNATYPNPKIMMAAMDYLTKLKKSPEDMEESILYHTDRKGHLNPEVKLIQPDKKQKESDTTDNVRFPGINPLGYITGAAGIGLKALLNATQTGPAMGRTVALQRVNVNPQLQALRKAYNEQLGSQLYALKENSPTQGNYLTNATLAASKGFADRGVQEANIIGQGIAQNNQIANEEEIRNQAIQYQNAENLEKFKDQKYNNWNTIINDFSNLGQVLSEDLNKQRVQNFILNNLIKTGNLKWGKNGLLVKTVDENGNVDWKPFTGVDMLTIQSLISNFDPYAKPEENKFMLELLTKIGKLSEGK